MATPSADEISHLYLSAYLTGAFVELFLDGIFTALIIFTSLVIATSRRTHTLSDYIIYASVFLLYTMAVIRLGSWAFHVHDAFINHTGPTATIYGFFHMLDPQALVRNIMAIAMTFVADLILVWRVFALWGSNWKVGLLPLILALFALAFGIQYVDLATKPSNLVSLTRIDIFSGTYYGSTLANTLISTILIIWRVHSLGGTAGLSRYWRVLAIVVESAALYSVILIIYMPFVTGTDFATHAPVYVMQSIVIPMTGIAPTLLVVRVLLNKENNAGLNQRNTRSFMNSMKFVSLSAVPVSSASEATNINPVDHLHEHGDEDSKLDPVQDPITLSRNDEGKSEDTDSTTIHTSTRP